MYSLIIGVILSYVYFLYLEYKRNTKQSEKFGAYFGTIIWIIIGSEIVHFAIAIIIKYLP